jgi:hypothetical protein
MNAVVVTHGFASLDKPGQRGFGNSDAPTHVDELDSMLGDESANEAGSRIQQFSGPVHCENAIHNVSTFHRCLRSGRGYLTSVATTM